MKIWKLWVYSLTDFAWVILVVEHIAHGEIRIVHGCHTLVSHHGDGSQGLRSVNLSGKGGGIVGTLITIFNEEIVLKWNLGNHLHVIQCVFKTWVASVGDHGKNRTWHSLWEGLSNGLILDFLAHFWLLSFWKFVRICNFLILFLVPHTIVYLLNSLFSLVGSVNRLSIIVRDSSEFGSACDGTSFLMD